MGDFVTRKDKGIDNPNATGDDGEPIRPNTRIVINVQPHLHDNSRAVLPVPTVDWRSNPRGQFIPIHGIDFLIGVTSLLIKQTVELNELSSKIESENRYIVKVPNGEELFIASEVSSPTQRCLCGSGRGFLMHLHDNTRQEALQFKRRLAAASCCFPCRLQELQVITPPGDYVGRVIQHWTWMIPYFTVRDINDEIIFVIEGPAVIKRSALVSSQFRIMTGDSLREIGRIVHGWDRELVSFTTTLHMPDDVTQPKHKALLLGATFLLPTSKQPKTNKEKKWYHEQYYHGKKDEENRKHGKGQNNWTSAESIENYVGRFVQNTMHGYGVYRWRILGPIGVNSTYEGYFFSNRIHGYGMASYGDGTVFRGLYYNDKRFGPGIESFTNCHANVGLWNGSQLIRLAWHPILPIVPNFCTDFFKADYVEHYRSKMIAKVLKPWELNPALDFLKQWGANPIVADEKWKLMYSRLNTDFQSVMCHKELFLHSYYDEKIDVLYEHYEAIHAVPSNYSSSNDEVNENPTKLLLAWNNSTIMKDMMSYAYAQDYQKSKCYTVNNFDLIKILSGQRDSFQPSENYENDCRTLLMASYLGNLERVVRLLNEANVNVDVSDCLGNTAIIYATCSDENEIIRFLIDAGCTVDYMNDSCCTALSIALIRYICIQAEVPLAAIVDAVIPASKNIIDKSYEKVEDWAIIRVLPPETAQHRISHPKISRTKTLSSRALKSRSSVRAIKSSKITSEPSQSFTDIVNFYHVITAEYYNKLDDINAHAPNIKGGFNYLFEVGADLTSVVAEKLIGISVVNEPKSVKQSANSKTKLFASFSRFTEVTEEKPYEDDELKTQALSRVYSTILQLLEAGANPNHIDCPQPPLVMAICGKRPQLIHDLVNYGADPNAVYPQFKNITPLGLVVARGFQPETLTIARALLEEGADPNVRLPSDTEEPGPPLLFAAFFMTPTSPIQNKTHTDLLKMFIDFGCDASVMYNDVTLMELTMSTKILMFEDLIKCPKLDLNKEINSQRRTILVKFFRLPFFFTMDPLSRLNLLTNLMSCGADPMLKCQDGEEEFENLFVYVKKNCEECFHKAPKEPPEPPVNVPPHKTKDAKHSASSKGISNDQVHYREAIHLMTNCMREFHIRWLQATLFKELVTIVDEYKHRHWPFVMKDHKHKKQCRLWLTPERCLTMWGIFNTTKKKKYQDNKVLRMSLCIVHYYNNGHSLKRKMMFDEIQDIEHNIRLLLKERVSGSKGEEDPEDSIDIKSRSVTPELSSEKDPKFRICYDCCMPLPEDKIQCKVCKLVYFCDEDCRLATAHRNDHPCDKNKFVENTETTLDPGTVTV